MAVTIRSLLTSGPVLVPLTSGATLRLSPGQCSPEVDDVEVAGNAKVDKLRQRGVIEVQADGEAYEAPETAPEAASAPQATRSRARRRSDLPG
jgi:hypothetical protein